MLILPAPDAVKTQYALRILGGPYDWNVLPPGPHLEDAAEDACFHFEHDTTSHSVEVVRRRVHTWSDGSEYREAWTVIDTITRERAALDELVVLGQDIERSPLAETTSDQR
jgi:hypothetical protein